MIEKKAFVLDTNFIVQEKDLDNVIENLSSRFSLYVTQVSVDERIAQQCRELKKRYDEIERIKEQSRDIIEEIRMKHTFDEKEKRYQNAIQNKYKQTFGERLIPLPREGDTLATILKRANKKEPPFLSDDRASDKGFKDALIWESILEFFAKSGEQEVLLITDDGGFTKNEIALCKEFNEVTGKTLSILPNSYYRELLNPKKESEPKTRQKLPNVEQLRGQIQRAIDDLRYVGIEGYWGDIVYEKTYTTDCLFDVDYIQGIFQNLNQVVSDNLFETALPASVILDQDDRINDTRYGIPLASIETVLNLYEEIAEKHPEYLSQFFSAVAKNLNQNYEAPDDATLKNTLVEDDDELPF